MLELDAEQLRTKFQQAAHSFSQLHLNFLNNVPIDFAINMRREHKLESFRRYISDLAHGIQFHGNEEEFSNDAAHEFSDRFSAEYSSYKEEWKDIQRLLTTMAAGTGLSTIASSASTYLQGSLFLPGLLATAATATFLGLSNAVLSRRKLDRKPLGVVMRLDRAAHQ